ncbi:MAG: PstS family phosphate ABC transporter substrate-binding protein [Caldilineaceae bacterium]
MGRQVPLITKGLSTRWLFADHLWRQRYRQHTWARWAGTLFLCIWLTVACSTATPEQQTATTYEEAAIEHFINTAPDAVSVAASDAVVAAATPQATAAGLLLPEVNPAALEGDLYSSGSPPLGALTQRIFARFVDDGFSGYLHLENQGTHIGYEDFCGVHPDRPLADFAGGNRPMLQGELALCLQRGRVPLAFMVGLAPLVVVTHPNNDFVTNVSLDELRTLFTARRWSDVNTSWPERKVTQVILAPIHSPFVFFAEVVFGSNQQRLRNAPNLQFAADDSEIAEKIQDNPNAIGFISYTTYLRNQSRLRLVRLAGILPTVTTVQRGEWPLVMPMIFYSTAELLQTKPQLAGFLNYYLTYLPQELGALGLFPVTQATLDRAKINLLQGTENVIWLEDVAAAQVQTQPTPGQTPLSTTQPTVGATPTVTR